MPKTNLTTNECIQQIVDKIRAEPSDVTIEPAIAELVKQKGVWVKEAITDRLTAGTADVYSQKVQDDLRKRFSIEMSAEQKARLQTIPFETDEYLVDTLDIVQLIMSLIPKDFGMIPREAHLTPVERDVWHYWVTGWDLEGICKWVLKYNGHEYTKGHMKRILKRVHEKVWNTPSLGWRTVFAEDMMRGKNHKMPVTVDASNRPVEFPNYED